MSINNNRLLKFILVTVIPLAAIACSTTVNSGPGQKPLSAFNAAEAVPVTEFNVLNKPWYSYDITKGQGMFNAVFLPFEYVVTGGEPDPNQRLTFPSLLSLKFDFVPDNYNSRHPAFVFRRDAGALTLSSSEAERISEYIAGWRATHAIGGKIVQHDDGYTGTMLVFDAAGKKILEQSYETQLGYFGLMGRMVETWMQFRGQEISAGLREELFYPMTRRMETVKMYGTSFAKEWRTDEEWELYEDILHIDPAFGEVRWWYANQKGWALGNDTEETINNKGRALEDHIVVSALEEFSYVFALCKDAGLRQLYLDRLAQAGKIMPDDPQIMAQRLSLKKDVPFKELLDYLPAARKYTSCYQLLTELADRFYRLGNYTYAIPLELSAVQSGYLPGTGGYSFRYWRLSEMFRQLDFYEEALLCCALGLREDGGENRNAWLHYNWGEALRGQFIFESAANAYLVAYDFLKEESALLFGYLGLYEAGNRERIKQWQQDPVTGRIPPRVEPFITARDLTAAGNYSAAIKLLDEKITAANGYDARLRFEAELIKADAALMQNNNALAVKYITGLFIAHPTRRQLIYLIYRAFRNDLQLQGRITELLSFLYPGADYYKEFLAGLQKQGYKPAAPAIVLENYKAIAGMTVNTESSAASGLPFNPFLTEYTLMRMKALLKSGTIKAADIPVSYSKTLVAYIAAPVSDLRYNLKLIFYSLLMEY